MKPSYIFTDPVLLKKKIADYFEFKKNDFDLKYDVVKSGIEAGKELTIKVPRHPNIVDLSIFLGVTSTTFNRYYRKYKDSEDRINGLVVDSGGDLSVLCDDDLCLYYLARAYDRIMNHIATGGMNGTIEPGLAKIMTGLRDTVDVNTTVTVQALPTTISNNIIDLTDYNLKLNE